MNGHVRHRDGKPARMVLHALTLATLTWPTAPAWAQDRVDLEALRDSYQPPTETMDASEIGITTVTAETDAGVDAVRREVPVVAGYRFPETIDELIDLAGQELNGRPERAVLTEACDLVARLGGAQEAWSKHCANRTEPDEATQ